MPQLDLRICARPQCKKQYRPCHKKQQYCSHTCWNFISRTKPKRRRPIEDRFWEKVDKTPGHGPKGDCWIWTAGHLPKGYGSLVRYESLGKERKSVLAHRLAWEFEHGPIPDGMNVLHKCDNPPCVRHNHLFLGTLQDNNRDAIEKGRAVRGARVGGAKLTDERVLEIRALHASKMNVVLIALRFGVTRSNITYIVNRKTWKHV